MISSDEFRVQLLENPVNWVLSAILLILAQSQVRAYLAPSLESPKVASTPDSYNWLPPKYPESRV